MDVFPMHVGVFPESWKVKDDISSLPHARGGVSKSEILRRLKIRSSPCTWGCFRPLKQINAFRAVFPMHVGVFPRHTYSVRKTESLPHARGGVSK